MLVFIYNNVCCDIFEKLKLRSSGSICKVVLSSLFRHSLFNKIFVPIRESVKIMEMKSMKDGTTQTSLEIKS
jgi:hypothetical protein